MLNLKLSSVLLFALTIPPLFHYWLGDFTYVIYGFVFLGLIIYILLDLKLRDNGLDGKIYRLKLGLLLSILVLTIGSVMSISITTRHQRAPVFNVHDIILQVETGVHYLIEGKNPYVETYFGTPLEEWDYREMGGNKVVNPALYYFVMPPFYLLLHAPFYFASMIYPHYFDARVVLIFLLGLTILLTIKLTKPGENQLLFITLLALNPANFEYFIAGRSDLFVFAFLFLTWFLLSKKRIVLSGITLALALGSKQSAWPIIPFFLAYLFLEKRGKIGEIIKSLTPGILVALLIFVPFLLWNFKAFLESLFLYLSGGVANSYPISGYGFGMVLYTFGIIKDIHVYYPFIIWQVIICLPLLLLFLLWQKKENTVKKLIFSYGIFLFIFWYFSRFFNNNHLAYLSMIFISAYFWPSDEKMEQSDISYTRSNRWFKNKK